MGNKLLEGESAEGLTGGKNANIEDKNEEEEDKEELLTEHEDTPPVKEAGGQNGCYQFVNVYFYFTLLCIQ